MFFFFFRWIYKGNKERARLEQEKEQATMQIKPDPTVDVISVSQTSEKSGFTNLAFQSGDCIKN